MVYRTQAEGIRALNRSYYIRALAFGAISVVFTSASLYMLEKFIFNASGFSIAPLILVSTPILLQAGSSLLGLTTLNLLWHSISLAHLYQCNTKPLEPGMQTLFYGFLAAAPVLNFMPPIAPIVIPVSIGLAIYDSIFTYKDLSDKVERSM